MHRHKGWKSVFSYIGTTHNCSKYVYRSKNVLVPKWAKKRSVGGHRRYRDERLSSRNCGKVVTSPPPHPRAEERSGSLGLYQVVLSLLCLWPYGNSLIVSSHSEFYQCHTQNRSRYHAASEAGRSSRGRQPGRRGGAERCRQGSRPLRGERWE